MSAPPVSRTPASPAANRASRPGWRDPRLAIGIGLVALCGLVGARLLDGADDTVAVWSLRSDAVTGQPLRDADVRAVRIHFGSATEADRYVSAESPLPDGVVLARDVGAGELLPSAALGSRSDGDLVELPVTLPSRAVPATLRVGSTVDIWVTAEHARASELVLEGVTVLALPAEQASLGPSADRQIIVGLDQARQRDLPVSLARLARGAVTVTRRAD